MTNLVACLTQFDKVQVYETCFAPKDYLKEVLVSKLRSFMMSDVYPEEQTPLSPASKNSEGDEPPFALKRPSVFLREVESYMATLLDLDDSFNLNLYDMLKDVWLEQIDLFQAKKVGLDAPDAAIAKKESKSKAKRGAAGVVNPQNQNFLVTYANWYVEHIKEKGASGTATYSVLKKALISGGASAFKSQQFIDPSELNALCRLVGPYGVRYIDERLNQHIFLLTKDIKDVVTLNQEAFQTIQKVWYQEPKLDENVKKLKQMDLLIQSSINLGVILQFRQNLFEALGVVLDENVPAVYQSVKSAHARYPANFYGVPDFLSIDNLANFVGVNFTSDTTIRMWMQAHCRNPNSDQRIYALFPYVYAVVLRMISLDDRSMYSTLLDSLDNNADAIALTVSTLMTSLLAITAPNDLDQMNLVHREFLQVSATVLLRTKADKETIRSDSIKSCLLLLHKFTQLSPFLTESSLEEFIPYSLIRATYSDFFRKEGQRKRLQTKAEEEVA